MTAVAFENSSTTAVELLLLPLEALHESSKNPRKHYEPGALQQLADNLQTVGQITPVLVRPRPNGGYEIAAGHRRYRAAKLAGLTSLTAIVRELDEAQFVEILNIENLQRDDLNALEEAQGFVTLMTEAGYDVPKIADRVGRSIKYVYDRIKLLQLIPAAKKLLLEGTITPGHGILLARLIKEDQERALEINDNSYRTDGGVLEAEHVDESYFPELLEDPQAKQNDGPVKARSVRELQQWIDRNIRFVPDKVDQGDLAFDLPKTAEILEAAAGGKLKVVKITREYRVPDEARDEKERTYGSQSWKRADGEPEADFYGSKPKPSVTCEHSRVGLVVAGPGRGEAFLVCVNKEKCSVHWAQEMKQRPQIDPDVLPHELRERWIEEELASRVPDIVKHVKAVITELKISDEICWNLVNSELYIDGWSKVGKRGFNYGGRGTEYADMLEPLVTAHLPGRFESKGAVRGADGPGARTELAWQIWLARDYQGLDESVDKAVAARWAAQRKAAAKQSAQTSAKAKSKKAPQAKAARKAGKK